MGTDSTFGTKCAFITEEEMIMCYLYVTMGKHKQAQVVFCLFNTITGAVQKLFRVDICIIYIFCFRTGAKLINVTDVHFQVIWSKTFLSLSLRMCI